MLVNNWYQETGNHASSLLLKRSSSFKKKKPSQNPKAVGKIYIQCLYLTVAKSCQSIPTSMNEALEALNTKRFHQTKWQSGYLFYHNEHSKVNRYYIRQMFIQHLFTFYIYSLLEKDFLL